MIRIVNSSSLPNNISTEKIHLAESETHPKLYTGPNLPIAGPTLPSVVATPPIAVKKSIPVNVIKSDPNIKVIR